MVTLTGRNVAILPLLYYIAVDTAERFSAIEIAPGRIGWVMRAGQGIRIGGSGLRSLFSSSDALSAMGSKFERGEP